jgi:hypothetical protein
MKKMLVDDSLSDNSLKGVAIIFFFLGVSAIVLHPNTYFYYET